PFNPAIASPWEAKSDWDIFKRLALAVSDIAKDADMEPIKEVVATPLMHDSKQELAQPFGRIQDWSKGEGKPIPGKTMPQIHVVERDYRQDYDKMNARGPDVETKPLGANGISWTANPEYDELKEMLGTIYGGVADGCPDIRKSLHASEPVLTLS